MTHGILGGPWLVDHVHPSFEGHQLIADALVELMADQGSVDPHDGWRNEAHAAYRRHFESLDEMYFLRGQRTLNSVWARNHGRAGVLDVCSDGMKGANYAGNRTSVG